MEASRVAGPMLGSISATLAMNADKSSLLNEKRVSVVKRNGMIVPFRRERIVHAIEKAFRAVRGISVSLPLPSDLHAEVRRLAERVEHEVRDRESDQQAVSVEQIQDLVEIVLMQEKHFDVGRAYIVYRDEHKEAREGSPENLLVLRRDGSTKVRFKPIKISSAIEKAFRAHLCIEDEIPEDVLASINLLTAKVVQACMRLVREGTPLNVELIQDQIEYFMMDEKFFRVAKEFIIYRASRNREREEEATAFYGARASEKESVQEVASTLRERSDEGQLFPITTKEGTSGELSEGELRGRIAFACQGFDLTLVSVEGVLQESLKNFYDGIKEDEIDTSNIMAARSKMDHEPAYSFVAARLLLDVIYRETMGVSATSPYLEKTHMAYLKKAIAKGCDAERIDPALLAFDFERLSSALVLKRDFQFQYLGLQTLYDRYLIHIDEVKLETPQIFWMRVAMGLALKESGDITARAIEFYDVLSQFLFVSSTPTLFNSGTLHPQMSSCYLTTVMDDLEHIFKCISDDALLSKWAGGLGNDWTNVRATGARIKGTNGKSQGIVPFLKVANDTAVAVNQGGKRKGAMCAYVETWHLDIEDFLELRKNTGDERRRAHDMNTANWIPDLFMKRVLENKNWTLFNPSDVPDLHDLYGSAFERRYEAYERMIEEGKITLFKKIEALTLWRKMLSMLFETGHPWITFKDPSNVRSPQDHVGVVHSSNLCTEILLNTSAEETAVCNLGSVNLVAHINDGKLDEEKLSKTTKTAVRMLDNVIDINFYPTKEAKQANLRHRPIGLGLMGFQDALYALHIPYASDDAVIFADKSMEMLSYHAILASAHLAEERGAYSSFAGSKWSKGILPIDSLRLIEDERGSGFCELNFDTSLNWENVRDAVKKYGMRNSNTLAIAPTATISNITGVTQSIEPTYKHLYAKSNLSGEFVVTNTFLVDALKKINLWDAEMVDDLKYFDGSILEIQRIPDDLKRIYLTAFEIEPEWLIECASRRQKWIDMGQSLNLYLALPNGKKLNDMYFLSWKLGLKTTYYLRTLGATQIEKSTTDLNRRGLQPRWMKNKSASSNVEVARQDSTVSLEIPKVCGLDGECESCQ
jgi:ribonucleoside-diphosphate reductase alpha chain